MRCIHGQTPGDDVVIIYSKCVREKKKIKKKTISKKVRVTSNIKYY